MLAKSITNRTRIRNNMLTIKVVRDNEIYLYESETVTIHDKYNHPEELKKFIDECLISTSDLGKPIDHGDMCAVIFAGGHTSYLYKGEEVYVTNSTGKTIYHLNFNYS